MNLLKHFIRSFIDWLFRRRSLALLIIRIGSSILLLAFGSGWLLDISLPSREGRIDITLDTVGEMPLSIVYAMKVIGLALIVVGLIWEFYRFRVEQRRITRKKIIVIEARGLRDNRGSSLMEALPTALEGYRDYVSIDLRQRVKDGEIVAPDAALEDLISLPADLKRREDGIDQRDVLRVYGGLTPVPFTFLTGVLIDDEGKVLILDWDRHAETWRELDGTDDGKRFRVGVVDNMSLDGAKEVALAVSVSYAVIVKDVRTRIGDIPIIELKLEDLSPDCHWSEEKQRALGQQFLKVAIDFSNRGVERIHLFLAAQNSVVFRFGRLYDKRNLPEVIVYQYKRSVVPPYPWGVLMPVCGVEQPEIIF